MQQKNRGVTLIEVLLVLVIATAILMMLINYVQRKGEDARRSHTSVQMQAIMNASLAYYVENNKWPTDLQNLQTEGYLPNTSPFNNPWGAPYYVSTSDINHNLGFLYVYTDAQNSINAQIIAGALPLAVPSTQPPLGFCTNTIGSDCRHVVAFLNVPAQSLNQARAVQFAGVYRNGGCVPVPDCPAELKPQIYVVPAEVNGIYTQPGANISVTPIAQFSAYAKGPVDLANGGQIQNCYNTNASVCKKSANTNITSGEYWRVCLSITTREGQVTPNAEAWGKDVGTLVALTRCVATDDNNSVVEPTGSNFNVWWY